MVEYDEYGKGYKIFYPSSKQTFIEISVQTTEQSHSEEQVSFAYDWWPFLSDERRKGIFQDWFNVCLPSSNKKGWIHS